MVVGMWMGVRSINLFHLSLRLEDGRLKRPEFGAVLHLVVCGVSFGELVWTRIQDADR